jgi:hypothetical protein
MKPDIKYINPRKRQRKLSNTTFREDIVYEAHSIDNPACEAYIQKSAYDLAIKALKVWHTQVGVENEVATDTLEELGELN